MFTKTLPVVGQEAVESKRNFPVLVEVPAAVNPPDQVLVPDNLKSPLLLELKVKFLLAPEIFDEITIFPVLSTFIALSVTLASTIFIVLLEPVSLFCNVKSLPDALFLRTVLFTLPTVAPFKVNVPVVADELPIVKARVLVPVIAIAPIDKELVPILIPAVVALPTLLNCATLAVVHAPAAVFGDQLVFVYQAVEAPELTQDIV